MSAHTPGPWLHGKSSDDIITPNGVGIASPCENYDEDQWQADARLIATAPELLAALRDVLPLAEAYLRHAPAHPDNGRLADARDAIAKATGRS